MKTLQKRLTVFTILLFFAAISNAASVVVETKTLEGGITNDTVRIVFHVTNDFSAREIAVVLHENETDFAWNFTVAATMLNHYTVDGNTSIKHVGFSGELNNWDANTNFKVGKKNKQVAVWLFLDLPNDTYGLAVQTEGESEVTTLFTDYKSRESVRGSNTATSANYCTLFFNDAGGNPSSCVELIESAAVVNRIEPYTFSDIGTHLSGNATDMNFNIYPTLAEHSINIVSEKMLTSLSVISINGQQLLHKANVEKIDISHLKAGVYLVKAIFTDGTVAIRKIVKQ